MYPTEIEIEGRSVTVVYSKCSKYWYFFRGDETLGTKYVTEQEAITAARNFLKQEAREATQRTWDTNLI